MHALALILVTALNEPGDKAPDDKDVVAGWTGALVFVSLILAVAIIGWALTRSLRTAQRAKDSGVFGDPPQGEGDEDQSNDAGPDSK